MSEDAPIEENEYISPLLKYIAPPALDALAETREPGYTIAGKFETLGEQAAAAMRHAAYIISADRKRQASLAMIEEQLCQAQDQLAQLKRDKEVLDDDFERDAGHDCRMIADWLSDSELLSGRKKSFSAGPITLGERNQGARVRLSVPDEELILLFPKLVETVQRQELDKKAALKRLSVEVREIPDPETGELIEVRQVVVTETEEVVANAVAYETTPSKKVWLRVSGREIVLAETGGDEVVLVAPQEEATDGAGV
jgi:hypothetical protein